MIVLLLVVIVGILLFGSGAVLGSVGALITGILLLLALLLIGWQGLLWLSGAIGLYVFARLAAAKADEKTRELIIQQSRERYSLESAEREHARSVASALARNNALDSAFEAKRRNRDG